MVTLGQSGTLTTKQLADDLQEGNTFVLGENALFAIETSATGHPDRGRRDRCNAFADELGIGLAAIRRSITCR